MALQYPCPCGSAKRFEICCEPFISGKKFPRTAKALMRSRYTAYTLVNIDYIEQTARGKAAEKFNPLSARQWAEQNSWLGLQVIQTKKGKATDGSGWVEFIAHYKDASGEHELHELSKFQKIDGRWYYV